MNALAIKLLVVTMTAGGLMTGGASEASAHTTSVPYHQQPLSATCGYYKVSGGKVTVEFPQQVVAYNRTTAYDAEWVYWRGYLERWNGSAWAVSHWKTTWHQAWVGEDRILEWSDWINPDQFTGLPRGYYRAAYQLFWSSRSVSHAQLVSNLRMQNEFNETHAVSYCTL